MTKLTSSEINWGDDMHIAVVANKKACGFWVSTLYPSKTVSEANDRFYIGSDWYLMDEYYIVYRKSEPVKKKVVLPTMPIMVVVNFFLGEAPSDKPKELIYKSLYNDSYNITSGIYICSIEQFNRCVKELSEASWMNDGEPMFYHVYKQAFKDMEALGCDEAYYRETPKAKPTYTQEMKDTGILPSVGMLSIVKINNSCWGEVEIVYINKKQFVCIDDNGDVLIHYIDNGEYFEPVDTRTPEQIQIDKIAKIINENHGADAEFIGKQIINELK